MSDLDDLTISIYLYNSFIKYITHKSGLQK